MIHCEARMCGSLNTSARNGKGMLDFKHMKKANKIVLFGGLAIAFFLALIFSVRMASSRNPRTSANNTWDSRSIECTFAGVRIREIDASNVAVEFLYDLRNVTNTDYQLVKGPGILLMSRLRPTGSLSAEQQIGLKSSVFIPSKNRTRIELEWKHAFNWPAQIDAATTANEFRQLVARDIAGLDGFVLFDETTHYQINLPSGW
jgi:hypothetical protein